jgi:hypothetical protein
MLNYGTPRKNEIEAHALGAVAILFVTNTLFPKSHTNLSSSITLTSKFLKNIGFSGQPINQEAHL